MCVPWRQMTIIRWTGGQSLQLLHSSLWVTKYMSAFVLYRKITQSSTGSLHVLQVQWHLSSDLRSKKTRYLLHLFPTQLWMGNRNRWNGRDMAIISPHKLQNPTQRIRKVPWSERASGLLAKLPCLFSVDAGSTFWEMIPFFFFNYPPLPPLKWTLRTTLSLAATQFLEPVSSQCKSENPKFILSLL